jgi:hypothetical protein
MGWISALALLVMIAVAVGGLRSFAIAPRKRPQVRGPFLVGVLCGVTVGLAMTARRRGFNTLAAATLRAGLRLQPAGAGISLAGLAAGALTVVAAVGRQLPVGSRVFRQTRGRVVDRCR